MKIEEAKKLLEEESFDGHIECESYESRKIRHLMFFDPSTEKWRTTVQENYEINVQELEGFCASDKQIESNDWVVWSAKKKVLFTEYVGEHA